MPSETPSPIQHIVVVMLENRSYDNVLGMLYANHTPPPGQAGLNGLTGSESNPTPPQDTKNPVVTDIPVAQAQNTATPYDPGELFCDMMQQLRGDIALPTSNEWASAPPQESQQNQGYVYNYASLTEGIFEKEPIVPEDAWPACMAYLSAEQVPVTAWLAENFAVCDTWFSSAPCQTYTNRCFSISGAPAIAPGLGRYSLLNDINYLFHSPISPLNVDQLENTPTIFSALDGAYPEGMNPSQVPNWKVYFHDYSITAQVSPYVAKAGMSPESGTNINLSTYDNSNWPPETVPYLLGSHGKLKNATSTFLEDLEQNRLPKLSLIEPRYSNNCDAPGSVTGLPPNSNHPGCAYLPHPFPTPNPTSPIDVINGEIFLYQLYSALQSSDSWASTLLIVTYDEPGGMYDHVFPDTPATQPVFASSHEAVPDGRSPAIPFVFQGDPSADGFHFQTFGGRVPTIVIGPCIEAGSRITSDEGFPFDHTSIIRTAWDCFLSQTESNLYLTSRVNSVSSLLPFLSGSNGTEAIPFPCPTEPVSYPPCPPESSTAASSSQEESDSSQDGLTALKHAKTGRLSAWPQE